MKIMRNLQSETNGIGVVLTKVEGSDHFEVRLGGFVMAKVSANAYAQMLRYGQAVNEPEMSWTTFGIMGGKSTHSCGGRKVICCDVAVKEDGLWLEPETEVTGDLLLFLEWSAWMTEGKTLTAGEGAKILASEKDEDWKLYFDIITMSPGARLDFATTNRRFVEGSGPTALHWFRERQYEDVVYRSQWKLSDDGYTLDTHPDDE